MILPHMILPKFWQGAEDLHSVDGSVAKIAAAHPQQWQNHGGQNYKKVRNTNSLIDSVIEAVVLDIAAQGTRRIPDVCALIRKKYTHPEFGA